MILHTKLSFNKKVDFNFSPHHSFLEYSSSVTLNVKIFKKTNNILRTRKSNGLTRGKIKGHNKGQNRIR